MTQKAIERIRQISLMLIAIVTFASNAYNYFVNYHLNKNNVAQWRLAMISIAIVLFLFSFRAWLGAHLKRHYYNVALLGWLTLYLLINVIGVCLGYNLHSRAFMMMLHTIAFFGIAHLLVKIWRNYYL